LVKGDFEILQRGLSEEKQEFGEQKAESAWLGGGGRERILTQTNSK
jgi:hypothetical protein